VILNFRPLKGALFGSVVPLREALDPLSAEGFTEVAAFYRNEGAVLFSPSFRKICPDIGFDKSLDHFLSTVDAWVVPAEKNLFACFGKDLITGKEDKSGIFLLQAGRIPDSSILGLASFRYSWGNFVVAVPGSEAGPVRQALSALERLRSSTVFDAVDHWGKDSETEYVLTEIFENFPEGFRDNGRFDRREVVTDPKGQPRTFRIYYHYRGRRWHREVLDGPLGPAGRGEASGAPPEKGGAIACPIVRGKGTRHGNEILIHFTTFIGGVLPLGDLSLPDSVLAGSGMACAHRFLRRISLETLLRARSLPSDSFAFSRFWDGSAFRIDGLDEISRLIDPGGWKDCMVLPFWMTHSGSLSEILAVSRVSDPLFVDSHRNMGVVLLRNCSRKAARRVVYENFRPRTKAHIELPMSIAEFMEGS